MPRRSRRPSGNCLGGLGVARHGHRPQLVAVAHLAKERVDARLRVGVYLPAQATHRVERAPGLAVVDAAYSLVGPLVARSLELDGPVPAVARKHLAKDVVPVDLKEEKHLRHVDRLRELLEPSALGEVAPLVLVQLAVDPPLPPFLAVRLDELLHLEGHERLEKDVEPVGDERVVVHHALLAASRRSPTSPARHRRATCGPESPATP